MKSYFNLGKEMHTQKTINMGPSMKSIGANRIKHVVITFFGRLKVFIVFLSVQPFPPVVTVSFLTIALHCRSLRDAPSSPIMFLLST